MNTNYALPFRRSNRTLPPGPRGAPLVGVSGEILRDRLRFFTGVAQRYGDIAYMRAGGAELYFISRPEWIKYVLQENHRNYQKSQLYRKMERLLGTGLVTSNGDFWLRQRRLAQPAFHRKRIAGMADQITALAAGVAERWRTAAEQNQPVDMTAEMLRLTLQVISTTMFSTNADSAAPTVERELQVVMDHTADTFWAALDLSALPTPRNLRFRRSITALDGVVMGIIEERRRSGQSGHDLLGMLLDARDEETGAQMDDRQLRDEVMTIYLAGHETTASTLTWAWYLLSLHPLVMQRLHAELDEQLGGRLPTFEDLPRLSYLRMVLDEVMRLYPAAWIISRTPLKDDEIGGYRIPAGAVVSISPYVVHRLPGLWDNPEGFDPQRFSPEQTATRHPYAFFPFAGGPRQCIGNSLALMESQLILATLAQRYRLDLLPGQRIQPDPSVTLRPNGPVLMRAVARG
ncbi:MAG: cytochrome P450 [Roseiflexaceae bacterium]